MDWRRTGAKPLSEPMMVNLLTHICVIRPQWVKSDAAIYSEWEGERDSGWVIDRQCTCCVNFCIVLTIFQGSGNDIPKFVYPQNHRLIRIAWKRMWPNFAVITMPWCRCVLQTELIASYDRLSIIVPCNDGIDKACTCKMWCVLIIHRSGLVDSHSLCGGPACIGDASSKNWRA